MPLPSGPGPIILSPAGFVYRVPQQAYVGGPGTHGNVVVAPAVIGPVVVSSVGEYPAPPLGGARGTIDCTFTTGAAGAPVSLVNLVDNALAPVASLGISLDASNRPYCVITDVLGTVVAESDVPAPAIDPGVPLRVRLSWDSAQAVDGPHFVRFLINDVPMAWVTDAVAAWDPFVPVSMLVGYGFGADFNGVLGFVQATNAVL